MKTLSILRFPARTAWQYAAHPVQSLRNTRIALAAFLRTIVVGRRAVAVLRSHRRFCSVHRYGQEWSVRTRGRYIWRVARRFWAGWILDRAGVRLVVRGFDTVAWSKPHVIVINHQSTLDVIACVRVIPNGRFVAKREVLQYPIIGRAAQDGGQAVIDRGDHEQSMKAIRMALQWWPGANLIFFAEGSRTLTGALGRFKLGAFAVAREANLPVLPVAISGAFGALPKGSLLRLRRNPEIQIEFGRVIPAHIVRETSVPALAAIAREEIARMIDQKPS